MKEALSIHDWHKGKFRTYSGIEADIMNPVAEMICVKDIAMGLANICRFGGQIGNHYSVAVHSLLVMHLAPPELSGYAIIHDASEAYLGDVIKPLKHLLGDKYRIIEELWMRRILEKYGLVYSKIDLIKPYDKRAIELESRYLQHGLRDREDMMFIGSFLEKFIGKSTGSIARVYEINFESVFKIGIK